MSGYLEVKYPFKSNLGLNPFKVCNVRSAQTVKKLFLALLSLFIFYSLGRNSGAF